jgi:hypothetical protein
MLLISKGGLENAKELLSSYKQGTIENMTPELWHAKKVVDSTLHPGSLSCCIKNMEELRD